MKQKLTISYKLFFACM